MTDYKVISADSHADEPASLLDQLPEEYQDKRPRIKTIDEDRYMILDGWPPLLITTPNPLNEDDQRGSVGQINRVEDIGVGDYRDLGLDIPYRIAEIEQDGVSTEVIYPNHSLTVGASPDAGYQIALTRLYNDFYAEHFGNHKDRFIPSAVIPIIDIDASIEEVKRVAKLGFRSMSVSVSRPQRPYNWPEYEPFWSTVEEVGIPLSFHVFSPGAPVDDPKSPSGLKSAHGEDLSGMLLGMAEAMSPLSLLTASGVLERHPTLKFVLVECGIGWLAWSLYTMDDVVKRRHMWQVPKLEMKPSEYFKRQGYITFGDDPVGLHNLHFTGVDCLMWGSDYPHEEGTFPHSQEVIEETFKDLSEEEKRKIVRENAAKLYGFSTKGA